MIEAILDVRYHASGMAWQIAWALVLGFGISGAVQAFVSRERVAELMGGSGVRSLSLATGFGCVSFSCSYAAAAMSKTLYRKGAHLAAATAFLIASTNLVIEIGLLIWVLLGWPFVVAAVLVDMIFGLVGLVPSGRSGRSLAHVTYFAWDYTTWLNLVFLPLGALMFYLGKK
jgi:uncharacterized membrane protein YraQ (UPF0718 family)